MYTNFRRPFIKRFMTDDEHHYIYDVNTNRILQVDGILYDILADYGDLASGEICQKHTPMHGKSMVENAIKEIQEAQTREKLFVPDLPHILSLGLTPGEYEHAYKTRLRQVVLDITEKCNLRCHYCDRKWMKTKEQNPKRRSMSTRTALTAIDFLKNHSSETKDRVLSFYGGETLMEFKLIKQCTEYALSMFGQDGIRFNLTTNGTLMNQAIAQYLVDNQFAITFSVDGPKRIHNRHRVDWEGNGCYERTMTGLRMLHNAYGADAHNQILINMVLTPPYDRDALSQLWEEQPWLPKDIITTINHVDTRETDFSQKYANQLSPGTNTRTKESTREAFKQSCITGESSGTPVAASLYESQLARFFRRAITKGPRKVSPLNGCCIPGVRRVFVTIDGKIKLCEKAAGSPILGTVYKGYNQQSMKNLLEEYAKKSIEFCRHCWAVNLCTFCFDHVYRRGKFSIKQKSTFCASRLKHLEASLKLYCSILEQDQHALDYMKEMVFV